MLTNQPLHDLISVAKTGNQHELAEKIKLFSSYASRLIETSLLACSLSNNQEGIEIVELTSTRLRTLIPLVINASQILCSFPNSSEALKNMEIFRTEWSNQVKLLNLAVDDITSINDFLAVSESQILEDINKCIIALNNLNAIEFKYSSDQVKDRTYRVCDMVQSEINNYEQCNFTNKITDSVKILRNKILVNFARSADYASEALETKPIRDPNENEFIDASRLIYDNVRELRNALLEIPQENPTDNLYDLEESEIENIPKHDLDLDKEEDDEEILDKNLSQEQQKQISEQLNSFRKEKSNFVREVLKWDDKSNDIVVLSKQMCVLMMDMTNFTRGKGPFKSIPDIINAAKKISELGARLEKLCRDLADECPESQSKKELIGHLNLIPLFCNQLNIGSKVQENIIDVNIVVSFVSIEF